VAVPERILIIGPSGAGKSVLARRIGERLGLPVVHVDAINRNPGWVQWGPCRRESAASC
jgi:adenylate kinase family enzyme